MELIKIQGPTHMIKGGHHLWNRPLTHTHNLPPTQYSFLSFTLLETYSNASYILQNADRAHLSSTF